MRLLGPFLLFTDLGFIVYWSVTAFGLVPAEYTFAGYPDPVLVAWNWSFLPLDLLVSATGLTAVWVHRIGDRRWRDLVLISLVLTSGAGLQAISFWAIRGELDLTWWLPNLLLLLYPPLFIPGLLRQPVGEQ